ncbi:hypothetical protein HYV88_00640 [Candidatus Woesearchaeota archaeon]|nr:hypothetical protein [Candidatus Woesearchaeota archaeon]
MEKINKKVFYFILLIFLNYVLIPAWLLIRDTKFRILYFIILILFLPFSAVFLRYLLNKTQIKTFEKPEKNFKLKFLLVSLFAFLSQIFLIFQPITFTDEIAYVSEGMYSFTILNNLSHSLFGFSIIVLSYLVLALLLLLFIIFRKINFKKYFEKKNFILYTLITFIVISVIIFILINSYLEVFLSKAFTSKSLDYKLSWLVAGIQIIYYTLPTLFLNLSEFSFRITSLLIFIAAGYFFIKLLQLLNIRRNIFYTLLIFFFIPSFSYFANLAFGTTELIFFTVSISYFLVRYEQHKDQNSLFYFILLSVLMVFFDKKANAFILGLLIFYILKLIIINKFRIREFLQQNKIILYSLLFISILTIPQNLIRSEQFYQTSLNELNPYLDNQESKFLNLSNWLSLFQSTRVLSNLPNQITIPMLILSIFSLFIVIPQILIRKNHQLLLLISIFLGYYIFFTSLIYNGSPRYTVPMLFIFPIFYIYFIKIIILKKPNLANFLNIFTLILSVFVIVFTLFLAYHNYQDRYLPADQLFSYIKQELPNEKFLKTMTPSSYNFYIIKNNLNFNNFDPTIWEKAENQTFDNLYDYMSENNITYFILLLPNYSYDSYYPRKYTTWLDLSNYKDLTSFPILNHSLVNDLYNEKSSKFKKIKEFAFGKNVMFIIKRIDS